MFDELSEMLAQHKKTFGKKKQQKDVFFTEANTSKSSTNSSRDRGQDISINIQQHIVDMVMEEANVEETFKEEEIVKEDETLKIEETFKAEETIKEEVKVKVEGKLKGEVKGEEKDNIKEEAQT